MQRSVSVRTHAVRALAVAICAAVLVALLPGTRAPALGPAAVWVSPTGSDATGTGSVGNPFRSIRVSLENVAAGGTVNVLPGTYRESSGEVFPLDLSAGVHIVGVGPGQARVVGSGEYEVFSAEFPAGDVSIANLEITGGGGAGVGANGGGIFAGVGPNSEFVITDCWIHDNETATGLNGGGIFANNFGATGLIQVSRCRIENNTADHEGGGVWLGGAGTIVVEDCLFRLNTNDGGGGGAMYVWNTADLSIEDCSILQNHSDWGTGFTIGATTGEAHITNCLVANNTSEFNGATGHLDTGNVVVDGLTAYGNWGAAGTHTLLPATNGTKILRNSIIWGCTPTRISGFDTIEYTCTQDGSVTGTGVITTDPQLGADWRLPRTSPCIDTGSPTDYPARDLDRHARPMDGDDSGSAVADMGAFELPTRATVKRVFGSDRYATGNAAWSGLFESAPAAVLATGEDFPDALAASGLAGAVRGPLLLVAKDSVPSAVMNRLQNLDVSGVYLVGGTNTISSGVESALENAGYAVTRLAGNDRYQTARKVAEETVGVMGSRASGYVFVARGDSFPDALAASPWAYATGTPVVLTEPDKLPPSTRQFITSHTPIVYVLGSTDAISANVSDDIDLIIPGSPTRLGGGDRYHTARLIAEEAVNERGALSWYEPGMATGEAFPDALTGGAACGARGTVLLLTATASLPSRTAGLITTHKPKMYRIVVYGSDDAVSSTVRAQVKSLLE